MNSMNLGLAITNELELRSIIVTPIILEIQIPKKICALHGECSLKKSILTY